MIADNDTSPLMTIAGRPFSVRGRAGGVMHLQIALQGGTASELARDLAALHGVRVVRGPSAIGGGTCFLVHCAGFKLVLTGDEADGSVSALVSCTPFEPGLQISELSAVLTLLLQAQPSRPSDAAPRRKGFSSRRPASAKQVEGTPSLKERSFSAAGFMRKKKPEPAESQPMRRTSIRPGKALVRRTPLSRKAPLGWSRSGRR